MNVVFSLSLRPNRKSSVLCQANLETPLGVRSELREVNKQGGAAGAVAVCLLSWFRLFSTDTDFLNEYWN